MDKFDKEYGLEVWGDIACFTRPELKVERVSYDVITIGGPEYIPVHILETGDTVGNHPYRGAESDKAFFRPA